MKLPQITVQRPITTTMVFLAVLLFGIVSLDMLPTDIMPNIELPTLTVITIYPGASSLEIEQNVTKPLEAVLSATESLKKISSTSKENVSFISLQFDWGADIDAATNNVRDILEFAKRRLPSEATTPILYRINSSMLPVIAYGIKAKESFNGIDKIIEGKIAAPLRKVDGVGTVIYLGHPEREIKIEVDPQKLQAYHLSIGQIATTLQAENLAIPGGNIKIGANDFAVRIPGEFKGTDEIGNLALTAVGGDVIRLCDVGQISDGYRDKEEIARVFDQKSVALFVQKQSGKNTLDVYKAATKRMEEIRQTLPPDVEVIEVMNSADIIKGSISNLTSTIWYAAIFVILVVLLFLRQGKTSLIIILTIPFSLIVAFIFMYIAGYSINIFSLMSLSIAIGMVVDNAIVVLENIIQHVERGSRPDQAAIFATGEMGMAISASTLTTIAVFLPMVFMGGIVGILFKQLALLTSITLVASLLTALSLTPMLASRLLRPLGENRQRKTYLFVASERVFIAIENGYKRTLGWALRHKLSVSAAALIAFIITIIVGSRLGTDYIPNFDAGDVAAVIQTEIGCNVGETERVARQIEQIFHEEAPGALSQFSIIGQTEDGALTTVGFKEGKNVATIMAHLCPPDERSESAVEIAERIRKRIEQIPEVAKCEVNGGNILMAGLMGNISPIEIEISGNDLDLLATTADTVYNQLRSLPFLNNVETGADAGKPEIQVIINKRKAAECGLNTTLVAMQVRQGLYGAEAGQYTEKGDEYTMTVRYSPECRNSIENLSNISLSTLTGQNIPLSTIADIRETSGPLEINRQAQQRIIKVKADIHNIALGEAVKRVKKQLAGMNFPDGVDVHIGGQVEDQRSSFKDLFLMFVIGVVLVYMVMAAQFESFKKPFSILFAIPFSIMGVIWAFKITGITLSIVSFIGIIMLLGIVVNNGIVLVDYTSLLEHRGYKLNEAIMESGRSRLRPVLMTSFTTILGMCPLAVSSGLGSEMWKPLGITVIGGLLVSTLITLLLVPVLYGIFHRKESQIATIVKTERI